MMIINMKIFLFYYFFMVYRHIFQLYYVYGGIISRIDNYDSELSPS